MIEQYLVIIEKGKNNFSAYSPDVLGCVATGKTVEQTVQQMTQALCFHLEDIYCQGEQFPQAQGLAKLMGEVNTAAGDFFTFVPINLSLLKVGKTKKS
jgi:predicted RNase H-like HicB family nuclease